MTIGDVVSFNRKSKIQKRPLNRKYLLTSAEVYNITWDDLNAAKWPMPPKICKLCTGKARKPYVA